MDASTRRSGPDLAGLANHVRALLSKSLAPHVYYHDVAHTFEDVVPAAERLAASEELAPEERLQIVSAAVLHDTGFVHRADNHERASATIAREILPRYGFDNGHVQAIVRLILATRVGHIPETNAEAVIMDADLDVLGRDDFWSKNLLLRRELLESGVRYDEIAWWRGQLRFLARHHYRTDSAKKDRGPGKRDNMRRVQEHLRHLLEERTAQGGL